MFINYADVRVGHVGSGKGNGRRSVGNAKAVRPFGFRATLQWFKTRPFGSNPKRADAWDFRSLGLTELS